MNRFAVFYRRTVRSAWRIGTVTLSAEAAKAALPGIEAGMGDFDSRTAAPLVAIVEGDVNTLFALDGQRRLRVSPEV